MHQQLQKPPGFNIHSYGYGIFESASGHLIDLNNPHLSKICIEDVAISLSNICRFGGHVKNFYSVAQHSVFVMHLAHDAIKKEALLHDAAEAYVGDVIKPLKNILGHHYAAKEALFMVEVCLQFGLDVHNLQKVKEYDMMALELEHEALQKGNPTPMLISMNMHDMMEGQQHCFWDNVTARIAFLNEYNKLFK